MPSFGQFFEPENVPCHLEKMFISTAFKATTNQSYYIFEAHPDSSSQKYLWRLMQYHVLRLRNWKQFVNLWPETTQLNFRISCWIPNTCVALSFPGAIPSDIQIQPQTIHWGPILLFCLLTCLSSYSSSNLSGFWFSYIISPIDFPLWFTVLTLYQHNSCR